MFVNFFSMQIRRFTGWIAAVLISWQLYEIFKKPVSFAGTFRYNKTSGRI